MPQKYTNLYIQVTVYQGKEIVTTFNAQQANWITNEISEDEVLQIEENSQIEIKKEGIQIKRPSQSNNLQSKAHYVFPSNEEHTWLENFYELAWTKNLEDRVLVLVQCMTKDNVTGKMSPIGYFIQDLCNPSDGKIKFGSYTGQLLAPPISFRD